VRRHAERAQQLSLRVSVVGLQEGV
jgi:hypothetical protein